MQFASRARAPKSNEEPCALSTSGASRSRFYTHDPRPYIQTGNEILAWLDRIGSRAGGLSRIVLKPQMSIESEGIRVSPGRDTDKLFKGDSGAGAWFVPSVRSPPKIGTLWGDNLRNRIRNSQVDVPSGGTFLGILISLNDDGALIVPSNQVSDFIAESLAPTRLGKISYKPNDIIVSRSMRGIPRWRGLVQSRAQFGLMAADALNSFSIEFDLRDNNYQPDGVTIHLLAESPYLTESAMSAEYSVALFLSQDEEILPQELEQSNLRSARFLCKKRYPKGSLSVRNSFYCPVVGQQSGTFLRVLIRSNSLKMIDLIAVETTREFK